MLKHSAQLREKVYKYLILLIGLLLFLYVAVRAYLLSFTYDECGTYLFIRVNAYKDLFSTANNHLLNSFFVWILSNIFGNSEIVLRAPNVLAYVLFLIYSYKLLKTLSNKWFALIGFLLLNLNPFMLDFFSLSRGYGLALGFMMVSLYYAFGYTHTYPENIRKQRSYSVLFASLAVLSNLILLNYLLSVLILFFLNDIVQRKSIKEWFRINVSSGIICSILLLILFPVVKILVEKKQLYHGGKEGFWNDTVGSILTSSFYFQSYPDWIRTWLEGFILLICGIGFFLFVYHLIIRKQVHLADRLFLVLALSVLIPVLQFLLFKTLLPVGRTGLFYIPMFILLFVCIIDHSSARLKRKWVNGVLTVFIGSTATLFSFHFLKTANLHYTYTWNYDADTRNAVEDLKKIYEGNGNEIGIGIDWRIEPSITYYRIKNQYAWLLPDPLNTPWYNDETNKSLNNKPHNAFLLFPHESYPYLTQRSELKLVRDYPVSGLGVLKKNE